VSGGAGRQAPEADAEQRISAATGSASLDIETVQAIERFARGGGPGLGQAVEIRIGGIGAGGMLLGRRATAAPAARASLPSQIRPDTVSPMKTLSVTEVARNFRAVIDRVEHQQEEIVLVRNRRQVARLVPEAPHQTALEVFGDLYRTLDDRTATALTAQMSVARKRRRGRLSELRNPWAG
jgi:antitoxin (DNA-binding transcriptional repressor) of toxin-antitoxin stability system